VIASVSTIASTVASRVTSAVTSGVASGATSTLASGVASGVASIGRQIDATLSAGSLENARSALSERRRIVQLRSAVDDAYRILELDRSA